MWVTYPIFLRGLTKKWVKLLFKACYFYRLFRSLPLLLAKMFHSSPIIWLKHSSHNGQSTYSQLFFISPYNLQLFLELKYSRLHKLILGTLEYISTHYTGVHTFKVRMAIKVDFFFSCICLIISIVAAGTMLSIRSSAKTDCESEKNNNAWTDLL